MPLRVLTALTVAALILASPGAPAQPVPLVVEKIAHSGTMPYVEGRNEEAARAAWRINQALYLDLLSMAAPVRRQDGVRAKRVQDAGRAGDGPTPVSDISFKVNRLDARLLSLALSFEGCGAYCEGRVSHYNFDARTGAELAAPQLFTPAGIRAVTALANKAELEQVRQHLSRLKTLEKTRETRAAAGKANDEDEAIEDRIELFETCLAQLQDPARNTFDRANEMAFRVEANRLVVTRGRCSNHAMRALDGLGDKDIPFAWAALKPHLSDYGRHLLLGEAPAAPPPSVFRSVLKGKVGTAPVVFRVGYPGYGEFVNGYYFYERFRTPIALGGKLDKGVLDLEEAAPEGKAAPRLSLRIEGGRLKGEWISGDKRLGVELEP